MSTLQHDRELSMCLQKCTENAHPNLIVQLYSTHPSILDGRVDGWMDGSARSPFPLLHRVRARMPGDGQHILMNLMSSLHIHSSRLAPVLSILSSMNGPHLAHLQNVWAQGTTIIARHNSLTSTRPCSTYMHPKSICEPSSRLGSLNCCASCVPISINSNVNTNMTPGNAYTEHPSR